MQTITRNRLAAALLAGGLVLAAMPLAQALAEPAPPAPPAPPSAPAAPGAPAAPHMDKIVIINSEGGDADDDAVNTRVVTREGKTFVFKTREPLSDAEVERSIADAVAAMPAPPEPPSAPGADGRRIEKRIIVREGPEGEEFDVAENDCSADKVSEVNALGESEGKQTRVKIRICRADGDRMADAVAAVRRARDDVARDANLPGDIRAQILGELDAEIARLERKPG